MARPKSPEKKELIRKAAIRVISEEGFYSCTTDKIAEEAGVSVGTIYNYFSDKEDIVSYIFKIERKKLNIYFKRFMRMDLSVPEKFKILIDKYFKYIFNNQKLTRLIHDESSRPVKKVTEEIFNYILAIRGHLKDLLEEGIEEGTIYQEHDLDLMVNMVIGSGNTIVFLSYLEPEKIDYICTHGPEKIFNILTNGIFKGKND